MGNHYFKEILTLMLFVLTIGYDINLAQSRFLFKWTVVNKHNIQNAVKEDFKNSHSYPKNFDQDIDETTRQRKLARGQVSDLERNARVKCKASKSNNAKNKPRNTSVNSGGQALAGASISTIYEGGNVTEIQSQYINVYRECISNTEKYG